MAAPVSVKILLVLVATISCSTDNKEADSSVSDDANAVSCGDGAAACTDASPSCEERQAKALQEVTAAAMSVPQCATDSDCKVVNVPADCLDCVWLAGGESLRSALSARTATLASICAGFHQAGCHLSPSGCPAVAGWACEQGKCAPR
jgi:hypothetical protein